MSSDIQGSLAAGGDQSLINQKLVDRGSRNSVAGFTPVSFAAVFQAAVDQRPMLRRIRPQSGGQTKVRKSFAFGKTRDDTIGILSRKIVVLFGPLKSGPVDFVVVGAYHDDETPSIAGDTL